MASKDATVEEAAGSAVETRITSTRVVSDWRPAKLLCKRFNIRDPYKQLPDVAPTEPASKGATLDSVFGEDDKHPSRKRVQNEVDLDLEELEKVGKLGYAMDNEEELSGVICVGAPIFNYTGYPCGAIWISGPKDRLSKEVVKNTVKAIKEVAGVISNELGFRK